MYRASFRSSVKTDYTITCIALRRLAITITSVLGINLKILIFEFADPISAIIGTISSFSTAMTYELNYLIESLSVPNFNYHM